MHTIYLKNVKLKFEIKRTEHNLQYKWGCHLRQNVSSSDSKPKILLFLQTTLVKKKLYSEQGYSF